MSDIKDNEEVFEEPVVVMSDEEGNEYFYVEEEIISVGDKRFAVLLPIDIDEEDCDCGCGDHDHDHFAGDAVIAKIEVNEKGEDVYCNPTDEEFDEVLKIYEENEEK